jgi:5-methylcytosine-specific restriction endonuclease McrA
METTPIAEAVTWLEKANADLEPELLTADMARKLLVAYARAEKLASFGKTVLARKLDDATEVARVTGTSVGSARTTVATGNALSHADEVRGAFQAGAISFDQATEIAKAAKTRPDAESKLLSLATTEAFHVLKDRARQVVLEAEQTRGLGERQHDARCARSYGDDLGMVHVHLALEPHVGTPIVNRAETEAARLHRKAKKDGRDEPFERHLADAYADMLDGTPTGRSRRPELVVVVSHGVAVRGWKNVKNGEVCKIPGVGPVSPDTARRIAADAFLTGVLYDGKDLRNIRRWTRNTPIEVRLALELGDPPEFNGVRCVDCGNRFRTEDDHVEPHGTGGPASIDNLKPRCRSCHRAKTERDRKAGKLRTQTSRAGRGPPHR